MNPICEAELSKVGSVYVLPTKNKKSTLRRKSSQLGTTIFIEGGRRISDVVHVFMCQTKRNPVTVVMPLYPSVFDTWRCTNSRRDYGDLLIFYSSYLLAWLSGSSEPV